jgi:hypothetical protein
MLDLAKEFLERDGKRRVVGAFVSPLLSVSSFKKHMVSPLQSWYTRAEIAHHAVFSHPFCAVDPMVEPYSSEWTSHPIHFLASRLARSVGKVTVVWVNGSDAVRGF